MQKSFITATPDSGSGDGTVTCSASQNNTELTRRTSITVSGGGITRTVSISQAAGTVTYEPVDAYVTPAVVPSSPLDDLPYTVGSTTVTIVSQKEKYINGSSTGLNVNEPFTLAVKGSGVQPVAWVTFDENNSDNMTSTGIGWQTGISWQRNTTTSRRTLTYVITQKNTGAKFEFTFEQQAASITPAKTLTANTGGAVWAAAYISNDNSVPGLAPSRFTSMTKSGNNFTKTWANSLEGYDFSQSSTFATMADINVGGTFYIRFTTSAGSWVGGRVFGPFTLQNSSQTVNCY